MAKLVKLACTLNHLSQVWKKLKLSNLLANLLARFHHLLFACVLKLNGIQCVLNSQEKLCMGGNNNHNTHHSLWEYPYEPQRKEKDPKSIP